MTRLLHISDTHFGTEQAPVVQALVRLAQASRPDVLVLSGDITQRAKREQFRDARAFCDSLGIPLRLTLPGNHDISLLNVFDRVVHPYEDYLREFGPELEPRLDTPELCVIGVKTTRRWRHKNGQVSAAQVEEVSDRLHQASAAQLRIVVVHQPVHVLRERDEHDRLHGWDIAVHAWADAGADIVMGGHIHLPYVCELSGIVPSLGRRMWCVQAGTAVSSRVRREAPNSVNLLHFDATATPLACRVERWDYAEAAGEFAVSHVSELNLSRP
jgi:3',5'-cyclic AMP phosphodiesterase CpdA